MLKELLLAVTGRGQGSSCCRDVEQNQAEALQPDTHCSLIPAGIYCYVLC